MFCPNCGSKGSYRSAYCAGCGTAIRKNEVLSEHERNTVGSLFFVTIQTLQEEEKLRPTKVAEISSFVLDNIDNLRTQNDCLKLLDSVAEKWPIIEEFYSVLDDLLQW